MRNRSISTRHFALAFTLGAAAVGILLTLAAKAIPRVMSKVMSGMMQNMMTRMKQSGGSPSEI